MAATKKNEQKLDALAAFFDEGAYTELYADKDGAVAAGYGTAEGCPAYALAQNGGALTGADVEKMVKVMDLAAKTGNPVVTFYDSKGSVLTEGFGALTDAARLVEAGARISGVVPQIAVVLGTCGATQAVAAAAADVTIMAKDAELFLTAPFTAAAQGDKTPGAGGAELAARDGIVELVYESAQAAVAAAANLVGILPGNNLSSPALFDFEAPEAALDMAKYTGEKAARAIVDAGNMVEFYKDYATHMFTALATVAGNVVGVVATEGPNNTMCAGCASKAARFVRLCDAFSIPVVTIVNTDGFVKSTANDVHGGVRAAARLAATYADATTAKVAVITGKAVGAAYTALCSADLTIALDTAVIAPVEPKAAVTILWQDKLEKSSDLERDTAALAAEYTAQYASAAAAVKAGAADFAADASSLRSTVVAALDILGTKRVQRLPKKHGNLSL
ncbi:propionyl-CoA carboxylase [Anaerofilum sp. BX8]|uniref:Propionyl-CoA carboxylase n=1 Tax=Anaerofilum hominis TaxID=2763016 RepID=A0A923KWQ8_9FIRM|nr:carboxyl transferase domain-containing protein [Anaerofilum hominis]MBC5582171.1 propionyl-CoA carboxylase [Anaerofilum hominis]